MPEASFIFPKSQFSLPKGKAPVKGRGGRYMAEKLSKADISAFVKLSETYRYQNSEIC